MHTKIICTIGPASANTEILVQMINSGMSIARINFSHGNYKTHSEIIKNIRAASKKTGIYIPIIADLPGPKIRVGKLVGGKIILNENTEIKIHNDNLTGNEKRFSTSYRNFVKDVKISENILIDDGLIKLKVLSKKDNYINCLVINGGILKENKGINLPGTNLSLLSPTLKDLEVVRFAINNKLDIIAFSFVRRKTEIEKLKNFIKKFNLEIPIIAKIERREALENIDDIIRISDAVMVARGDLGVEISPEEVPEKQKILISKCNDFNKPVITATQMLESMINNDIPTRAEVSDVANSVLDGTDCVMLSAETSIGINPVKVIKTMKRIVERAELSINSVFRYKNKNSQLRSLCYSATKIAEDVESKAIITVTESGKSPAYLSGHRVKTIILAITKFRHVYSKIFLLWGVHPFLTRINPNKKDFSIKILKIIKKFQTTKKDSKIIVLFNSKNKSNESADSLRIFDL